MGSLRHCVTPMVLCDPSGNTQRTLEEWWL